MSATEQKATSSAEVVVVVDLLSDLVDLGSQIRTATGPHRQASIRSIYVSDRERSFFSSVASLRGRVVEI